MFSSQFIIYASSFISGRVHLDYTPLNLDDTAFKFSANIFPYELVPNVPNNMPRNHPFCFSASFLVDLLTPFIDKLEYSRI